MSRGQLCPWGGTLYVHLSTTKQLLISTLIGLHLVVKAENALHALHVQVHYLSCGDVLGRVWKQDRPPRIDRKKLLLVAAPYEWTIRSQLWRAEREKMVRGLP